MEEGKGIPIEKALPPAPVTQKTTAEDFAREYDALCERMGWQIGGKPALKPMNDLGGCMISVQMVIVPFQGQKK